MKNNVLVSIIIPTYNSEKHIEKCLISIKEQSYKNIEIIVVDQESMDNTEKIANSFGVRVIRVRKPRFYSPPSKSRNIGAKKAKGEILYHLDSDMQLSKGLIKEAVGIFDRNKNIGALIVHEIDIANNFWARCKALERRCYWGNDNIESARIVRVAIFNKVNGYDEKLSSGEDFDTQRKYAKITKVDFCKNVTYHNLMSLTLMTSVVKKFNYGKTAGKYFKKHDENGLSLLLEECSAYVKNYKSLLSSPVLAIGMFFMKGLEFSAGGLGSIYSKVHRLQ